MTRMHPGTYRVTLVLFVHRGSSISIGPSGGLRDIRLHVCVCVCVATTQTAARVLPCADVPYVEHVLSITISTCFCACIASFAAAQNRTERIPRPQNSCSVGSRLRCSPRCAHCPSGTLNNYALRFACTEAACVFVKKGLRFRACIPNGKARMRSSIGMSVDWWPSGNWLHAFKTPYSRRWGTHDRGFVRECAAGQLVCLRGDFVRTVTGRLLELWHGI